MNAKKPPKESTRLRYPGTFEEAMATLVNAKPPRSKSKPETKRKATRK
jgi:hypothetical protein